MPMEPILAEAALFMSPEAVPLTALMKVMGTESHAKARRAMDELVANFNERNGSLEIILTQDDRYHMRVRNKYAGRGKHFAVTTDLSRAVLRTLAIIAYKQPIRQSIVVKMRGNKAYDHIKQLDEEGFIRREKESNTYSVETTKKFEEYFGPPVKDLDLAPSTTQEILEPDGQTTLSAAAEGLAEAAKEASDEFQEELEKEADAAGTAVQEHSVENA